MIAVIINKTGYRKCCSIYFIYLHIYRIYLSISLYLSFLLLSMFIDIYIYIRDGYLWISFDLDIGDDGRGEMIIPISIDLVGVCTPVVWVKNPFNLLLFSFAHPGRRCLTVTFILLSVLELQLEEVQSSSPETTKKIELFSIEIRLVV